MSKKIQVTKEQEAEMLKERGYIIDRMVKNHGYSKVKSWMNDPIKLRIINALAYLEVTDK